MHGVMNGQGTTRAPGVQAWPATEGGTDRREAHPVAGPSDGALAVLPRAVVVRPGDLDVVITPDLVADLYDPTLIISHGYVGPDRRRHDRSAPPEAGIPQWVRQIVSVVLLTAMVVIPLTLIAARSVPPAASGQSPAPETGQAAPKSTAGARTHTHVFGATSQQIARAEAAYQKALARVEATGVAAGPGTASTATATASIPAVASAGTAAPGAVTDGASPAAASPAAPSAAARRAATMAAASQARAQAQAAAAQRRQAAETARAQAQVARATARAAADAGSGAAGGATPGS